MPLPSAEMATSPTARSPPPLLPSSAPSGVSALSAAASDLTAVLSVAKRNFSKKRRQTLTSSTLPPRGAAPEADEDPLRARQRRSHQGDVKAPGALGRAGSGGGVVVGGGSSGSSSSSLSRSTVLTMASTPSSLSSSSSSSSPSLSRGQSLPPHQHYQQLHQQQFQQHGLHRGAADAAAESALPPLAADKARALVEFADRSVDDAYNLCHGFGRVRWAPSKTREGVAIHRARGEDDSILDAAVRGRCKVQATVGELLDALITESTAEFAAHEAAVNPSEFLDGQLLHTLVPRTPEDRFACVKWHGLRSLAPSVAKHRDYVYVELVDKFRGADGRLVGYRLAKSIELDELPPARTAAVFVRAKTLTLQTFAETADAGTLELTTMMINDLGERLPAWLVHKIVDTAAMRSACLRDHLNQRRIDFLVYANPSDMVPLSKRICCVVCTKSFTLVRKKYNCVACGDVMCGQCSVHQLVTTPSLSLDGPGKRKARLCVKCSSGMRSQELPRRRGSLRPSNESSSSSGRPSSQRSRRSDDGNRSFLSDTSGGAPSMDSRPSSFLGGYDDAAREGGSFSATGGGGRKPAPSPYGVRQPSASMGKRMSERSSKASTSSSTEDITAGSGSLHEDESSPGDDGAAEVEQRFPQLLGGSSILASAPVELDLGVGKYKETYKMEAQTAEVFELSDSDDDVGDFTHTETTGASSYQQQGEDASALPVQGVDDGDGDVGDFTNTEGSYPHPDGSASAHADGLHLTPLRAETVDVDVEVASFLTNEENSIDADEAEAGGACSGDVSDSDSDTSSFLTVDENSRIVRMSSFSSRGRTPPPQLPTEAPVGMDGLIVEELVPENASFRPSDGRRSGSESVSVEDEGEIPVVIRRVAKRVVVGGGSRRSRERRPVNPKVQAVVVESFAESQSKQQEQQQPPTDDEATDPSVDAAATPPAPTIQLADLQVHLDRMNEISESLRSLRSGMAATEKKATTQSAMAALESFETKAKADAAAKIAAGFVSAFERSRGPYDRASLSTSMLSAGGLSASTAALASSVAALLSSSSSGAHPRTSLFNLTLAMGDGSFCEYLVDSSFMDVTEGADGSGIGWKSVHSRTTGKVYFYNESCGLTSWTLPGPDTYKGAVYMVL